jgi:hypothetical protein
MTKLNRNARLNVRPNEKALFRAKVLRLVRAVEDLFARETLVGPSTFRQEPMLRVIVRHAAIGVRDTLTAREGDE